MHKIKHEDCVCQVCVCWEVQAHVQVGVSGVVPPPPVKKPAHAPEVRKFVHTSSHLVCRTVSQCLTVVTASG